jgi:hypothetical protein
MIIKMLEGRPLRIEVEKPKNYMIGGKSRGRS